jgi:hypothetical protein
MRPILAPTSAVTDVRGHNEKGRPVSVPATAAGRGNHSPYKPTGVRALIPCHASEILDNRIAFMSCDSPSTSERPAKQQPSC